jgi:hypothetical protein
MLVRKGADMVKPLNRCVPDQLTGLVAGSSGSLSSAFSTTSLSAGWIQYWPQARSAAPVDTGAAKGARLNQRDSTVGGILGHHEAAGARSDDDQ